MNTIFALASGRSGTHFLYELLRRNTRECVCRHETYSFANPSMIVIGGGLAQLGHILLAEIRSVVYRRSLPLATGNLPVVLSELGARAGVSGAAVLASDTAFEQAS